MWQKPSLSLYQLRDDYYKQRKQLIPLYEIAAAGLSTIFSSQNIQIPLDYIEVPNAPLCDGAIFIRGDSMYPLLKSGDIACFKTIVDIQDIRYGEMYLLDIENNSDTYLTTKYIHQSEKGDEYIKLVSENRHHAALDIHKSSLRALAIIKITIRYNTIS